MSHFAQWIFRHTPRGRRLVLWLIPFAFLNGLLAGLRWPSLWATGHMVFDYHFGIGKRGLFGTLLHLVAPPPYHYLTLARIGFIVFGIWLTLLSVAAWRIARRDTGIAASFVFFFLSAGFASLVCDMGYLEHFGLVIVMICLLLPHGRPWLALRAVMATAAVFLHEANFLMFVPLIAFDTWAVGGFRLARRALVEPLAVLAPASAAAFYLANVRTACDHAATLAYLQHKVRDFPIRDDAIETLCRTGATNLISVSYVWVKGWQLYFLFLALVVILPSAIYNMALLRSMLRGRPVVVAAAVLAILSPCALIFVGADLVRFTSLIQLTSLLALISIARRVGLPSGGTLPALLRNPVLLSAIAAYELSTSLVLTDGSVMMKFPFVPLALRLIEVVLGMAPLLIIPNA